MTYQIVLLDNPDEIIRLSDFLDAMIKRERLDFPTGFRIHLALEEACSNIIRYAYPGETGKTFRLDVETDDSSILFTLTDDGIPFNPLLNAPAVDTTLSAEERVIGGLGIFLLKNVMHEMNYERRGKFNILTMKYLKKQ